MLLYFLIITRSRFTVLAVACDLNENLYKSVLYKHCQTIPAIVRTLLRQIVFCWLIVFEMLWQSVNDC